MMISSESLAMHDLSRVSTHDEEYRDIPYLEGPALPGAQDDEGHRIVVSYTCASLSRYAQCVGYRI